MENDAGWRGTRPTTGSPGAAILRPGVRQGEEDQSRSKTTSLGRYSDIRVGSFISRNEQDPSYGCSWPSQVLEEKH